MEKVGLMAKEAAKKLRSISAENRNKALRQIAEALKNNKIDILRANSDDLKAAQKVNLSQVLLERMALDEKKIEAMAMAVESIAQQVEVLGEVVSSHVRSDGLKISKQRIPLGVIGMIFESRPNVVVDCSALAIKSGNAIILKGGKEAYYSNKILGETIKEAIKDYLPQDCIHVLSSDDRESVKKMLGMNGVIDLIIPRGGESLVDFVTKNSTIPVIAHYKGLCHVYIDQQTDLEQAMNVCLNAKVQRPGVCNAAETFLIHEGHSENFTPKLLTALLEKKVEIRGCPKTQKLNPNIKAASPLDWDTEYLDKKVSFKIVNSLEEAIDHINCHGSHHTEAILSSDQASIDKFTRAIDASCICINASTRFNDGGELGLGAEMGISTSKFHAYGPMGSAELTTTRFVVLGNGHIRK